MITRLIELAVCVQILVALAPYMSTPEFARSLLELLKLLGW